MTKRLTLENASRRNYGKRLGIDRENYVFCVRIRKNSIPNFHLKIVIFTHSYKNIGFFSYSYLRNGRSELFRYRVSDNRTDHDAHMSLDVRKPIFGVSDQVRHKLGCTATIDGKRPEISDLGRRGVVLSV